MGDTEDPEIYAAEPLLAWQKSPAGSWAMANCLTTPEWNLVPDHCNFGYTVIITGRMTEENYTFYRLKYDQAG